MAIDELHEKIKLLKELYFHFSNKEDSVLNQRRGYTQIFTALNVALIASFVVIVSDEKSRIPADMVSIILIIVSSLGFVANMLWARILYNFLIIIIHRYGYLIHLEKEIAGLDEGMRHYSTENLKIFMGGDNSPKWPDFDSLERRFWAQIWQSIRLSFNSDYCGNSRFNLLLGVALCLFWAALLVFSLFLF